MCVGSDPMPVTANGHGPTAWHCFVPVGWGQLPTGRATAVLISQWIFFSAWLFFPWGKELWAL